MLLAKAAWHGAGSSPHTTLNWRRGGSVLGSQAKRLRDGPNASPEAPLTTCSRLVGQHRRGPWAL